MKKRYKHPLAVYVDTYSVSISTIKRWAAEGYSLDDPKKLDVEVGAQKNRPESQSSADPEKRELERRKLQLQCERLEFQNNVERGRYTANDILREHGTRVGHAARTALMRLKADAPTWAGMQADEIETRVTKLIDGICRDLSNANSKLYDGPSR